MELSLRLKSALTSRNVDSDLIVRCRVIRDGPTRVEEEAVSTRTWACFVRLMQLRLCDARNNTDTPTTECSVGVLCAESFHTALVESACLVLGEPFCVFNPADPIKRQEALIRRRQPLLLLSDEDVSFLLAQASPYSCGCGDEDQTSSLVAPTRDTALAYFIYTSGSTGDPKCVRVSRHNLLSYVKNFAWSSKGLDAACVNTVSQLRTLCLSTPFFDPSIGDMATTFLSCRKLSDGAADAVMFCVLQESILNGELLPILLAVSPTHVVTTPAVWRSVTCVPHDTFLKACPNMKLFLGGERMSQSIIDAWADRVELHNIYGLTEATIYQSASPQVFPGTLTTDVSCGCGGAGTVLHLERLAEGGDCPPGESGSDEGEVILLGPQVCMGYADVSSKDQGGFIENDKGERCFRTGDIAVWNASGSERGMFLRGRRDWQVKINGQRVGLEEVEGAIQRVCGGAFTECCCCCVSTSGATCSVFTTPAVGLVAVLSQSACTTAQLAELTSPLSMSLTALLSLYLPTHMVPTRWRFLTTGERLPQTNTGKVDRKAAACLLEEDKLRIVKQDSTELQQQQQWDDENDPLTQMIRRVWCRFFGVSLITPLSSFFSLGGDSLGALKLTRAVLLAVQGGSDVGIDAFGGMPEPFQPCVLINNPTFAAYVAAVRKEMEVAEIGISLQAAFTTADAMKLTAGDQEGRKHRKAAADLSEPNPHENLLAVVATGNVVLTDIILSHGLYNVDGGNTRRRRCSTPLHVAVRLPIAGAHSCCVAMVELLLAKGAKPTCITADGVTPLHLAAAAGDDSDRAEPLQTLLSHPSASVGLHCRDYRQQSLLHFAAREGKAACVRLLLNVGGADLCVRDKWQRTPAHWAVLNKRVAVLETMVAYAMERLLVSEPAATGFDSAEPSKKKSRFTRLAQKKTYLAYETLDELAARVSPGDGEISWLVSTLSQIVEKE